MMSRSLGHWAFLGVLLLCGAPSANGEDWHFLAGEVSSVFTEGRENTVLEKGARIASETKEIRADRLELFGRELYRMEGRGGVVVQDFNEGITISADQVTYDRKAGVLLFRGQVVLEDEKENLVIRCESLENRENEKLVILQMSVRLIKENLVCRGEFALYRRGDDVLELSGLPVVWRGDDQYRAERIIVNLSTEEITLEGEVSGALSTDEEE